MQRGMMSEETVLWESNNGIIPSPDDFRANPIGKGATKRRYSNAIMDHTFYELSKLVYIGMLWIAS